MVAAERKNSRWSSRQKTPSHTASQSFELNMIKIINLRVCIHFEVVRKPLGIAVSQNVPVVIVCRHSLVPRCSNRPGYEASAGIASFPGTGTGLGMRLVRAYSLVPRHWNRPGNEASAGIASFPGARTGLGMRLVRA